MEWIEIIEDDFTTVRSICATKLFVPEYPELNLFVHTTIVEGLWEEDDGYTVTEYSSGAALIQGIPCRDDALQAVMSLISSYGLHEVKRRINETRERIRNHQ